MASFTTDRATLVMRYRTAVKWAVGSVVLHWAREHGRPQFNKEYTQSCMTDPGCQRLFGVVVLLLGPGSLFALAPIIFAEAGGLAAQAALLLRGGPRLQLIGALEGVLLDGEGRVDRSVVYRAAYGEALASVLLVLELLTPRRNFILVVLYGQYVQMRCMLERAVRGGSAEGPLHEAFSHMDGKVMKVVGTPYCPALIRWAYTKFKAVALRQVALPKPGEKPTAKCSIM